MHEGQEYTVIRTARRTVSLQIYPDGSIVVRAPRYASRKDIVSFVRDQKEWIRKRMNRIGSLPKAAKRIYESGELYMYLGQSYTLSFTGAGRIGIAGNTLAVPLGMKVRVKKELERWYKHEARTVITDQAERLSPRMGVAYTGIRFSDTRSKWGTCMHDNSLQFNWRLVMAPPLVIRYVVIHELAHIREKNHSSRFWDIVASYNPSYKQQRKWLRDNGHTLVF